MRTILFDTTLEVSRRASQLRSPEVGLTFAGSVQELGLILTLPPPHDVLIANVTGSTSGWELAEQIRRARFGGKIVALVDDLAYQGVRHLKQLPRAECLQRPSSSAFLDDIIRRIFRPSADHSEQLEPSAVLGRGEGFYGIVAQSPAMLDIFARIEKVATRNVNVCIHGESGTGKELIARAIHAASHRRDAPFVTLDCTAIPEGLMESHLFGHMRGAFTGAVETRDGLF